MARTGRTGSTAEQKRELRVRWKDGQSLSDIGRALGRHAGPVFGVLQATGGIAPPLRKRSAHALTIDAVSIRHRPAEIEERAVPGHWQGDLLSGGKNTHVATSVEHRSRFLMLAQVDGKDTGSVVDALVRQVQQLPQGLMSSPTWDRGVELAQHKLFAVAADVAVYFRDPRSPWQRGSNENTNGPLRQCLPRGSDPSVHSQDDLDAVARPLNTRPRKTLGCKTPAATLAQAVALTR